MPGQAPSGITTPKNLFDPNAIGWRSNSKMPNPNETRTAFYISSELASPTLRGALTNVNASINVRLPEHGLESLRQRISDMDNLTDGSGEGHESCDYDEYESLPEQSTFTTHMMAGAIAGMMEHCVMYPVDCVKTRMQSMRPEPNANYRNVANAFITIMRNEGFLRTFRGLNAVAVGAGPSHALYFACYEKMKHVLSTNPGKNPLANAAAGGMATILHDAAMNPIDVIKQRLQMYQSPFKNATECIRHIIRTEGSQAFYRSYTTQLTMNIPFQSVHFVTYEFGQELLNPHRQYNPISHVLAGGMAGATAAAITTPLDVCKTLLNTQENGVLAEKNSTAIIGMGNAIRTIYNLHGIRGFFKGLSARVIFQVPATALSWSGYEFFKYFISKKRTEI